MKKTKIVCTMGPSTLQAEVIESLILNGMNVARFNFSHGDHQSHQKHMQLVKSVASKLGVNIAIMLDTKGPEMRLGKFKSGKVMLTKGQTFILTGRQIDGDETIAAINHPSLAKEVNIGDNILLSDGLVRLKIIDIDDQDIITTIENSGEMSNNKRVAAPGANLSLPFLSEKDIADILFGLQQDIDFIAASFVQRAEDIQAIEDLLQQHNANVQIIAKIENAQGVKNMAEILALADGLMIARGDLGVEIPAEHVPLLQKQMIKLCNQIGKPVITATQMLESMTTNPRPTRAEASDVANAILDGSDAIMLSGETASGSYPIEAVQTMATIAQCIEPTLDSEQSLWRYGYHKTFTSNAICHAAVQVSHELNAQGIITITESGKTAQMVSKYRPMVPIFAISPEIKTLRKLQLVWGVIPIKGHEQAKSTDLMIRDAINQCITHNYLAKGDQAIITAGVPLGKVGTTNMIFVQTIGVDN
ncbi:pyruvate kinase [Orbus hercynius]|uniref:Pyruvate kinase n=1 Tax=Orbus hercynius TaxID=593135 RepID=A0A495RKG1_9GAMM|nr:pyruvate kinase [Orbus hercynius]RKS87790.1 pyruvate kinase [Orbus hercynius]